MLCANEKSVEWSDYPNKPWSGDGLQEIDLPSPLAGSNGGCRASED